MHMNTWQQTLATLSPEKRALLEARLRKKNDVRPTAAQSNATAKDEPAPLSFAQESFWFFDQLAPGKPLYNIPQAFRLVGELNTDALQQAFTTIIERHQILRTRFTAKDGRPFQSLRENWRFELPNKDLRNLSPADREIELSNELRAEAQRPFDLANDLMLRASLLRVADTEHVLLILIHHIAADAWSLNILYKELEQLYTTFTGSRTDSLPPLPSQYTEIAARQRRAFNDAAAERQLAFWKKQLAGELPVLELPTDLPRPATPTFRGAWKAIAFPAPLATAVKELGRRENITTYAILLAAFQTLLHRYSGQDEIIVGSPIGARLESDTEQLIGPFVNTVVIRTTFTEDDSFRDVAHQVRRIALDALDNKDVPIERLIEELNISRDPSRNPLFQVMFQFLSNPPSIPRLAGMKVSRLPMETGTAKFDLNLTLCDSESGIAGDLEFNTDLFTEETIDRIITHLQTLLEAAVAQPHRRISDLTLLSRDEERKLLVTWNRTHTDYPRNSSIAELFERQVQQHPTSTALLFDNQAITYSELNRRANKLAHHLRRQGIKPQTRVAICVERSVELIVGLLGILKAGAAYVPLDPNNPSQRLHYILEDTAAAALITTRSSHPVKFSDFAGPIVFVDDAETLAGESDHNPNLEITGEDLAYVMYTSGSTGKPKGVAIPQRGVVRLVSNPNYLSITSDDVFLLFAPVSFDASILEIWGPLLNGGKLAIFPAAFTSLKQLGEVLQRHKVTVLWLTAGLFHQMVEEHIDALRPVRKLLAGGDVLPVPDVLKVLRELPETELINGYGPTENTTFTCCYSVPRNWNGRSVPIGKPISNTQVYILDKKQKPVPIGVPGELFIGGDGLAREYLNAPELNRQKFVANTLIPSTTPTLYRTGDLVRWLPDGNIEFLGRADNQVKIRGFRVELDEIECAILQHPDIREAVVIAREDSAKTKQLFAYVVCRDGATASATSLRTFLESKLPAYMVPSSFTVLEKLPLNANGKVDRKSLPVPDTTAAVSSYAPPTNADEQRLVDIWAEVLKRNQIGIHDDFFQLGGHSLLATRVVSRINEAFSSDISLQAVFEHSTIAKLANLVAAQKGTSSSNRIIPRRARSGAINQPANA